MSKHAIANTAQPLRKVERQDMTTGTTIWTVDMPYDAFIQQFDQRHSGHPSDWDAPGPVELWFFELPWGLKIALEYHLAVSRFDIHAERFEVEAVLDFLDLRKHTHYPHTASMEMHKNAFPIFIENMQHANLFRLDDNGNTVLMHTYESRRVADYYQQVYESRGHKQLYWVEQRSQ